MACVLGIVILTKQLTIVYQGLSVERNPFSAKYQTL